MIAPTVDGATVGAQTARRIRPNGDDYLPQGYPIAPEPWLYSHRFLEAVHAALVAGIGSVLLLPELLTKPLCEGAIDQLNELGALLARLDLRPVDGATAELATALGAADWLRAADAVHLATAVIAGADRFITNNSADFPKSIAEIDITYPADLVMTERE